LADTKLDEKGFLCRSFRQKDEDEVKELIKNTFRNFLNGDFWEWKYKHNPCFVPSLIAVAEKNGKIVGCNHWLPRRLKITRNVEVEAVLSADIAVSPKYRRRGIGKSLLLYLRRRAANRKVDAAFTYMFANPNLSKRLYGPVAGYMPIKTSTVSYFKLLSWKRLMKHIASLNERIRKEESKENLSKQNLKIFFNISNAPLLILSFHGNRIEIEEDFCEDADVTISGDLSTFISLKEKKDIGNLIKALITRKIKVKGGLFSLIRLYRHIQLLREIFSVKIG